MFDLFWVSNFIKIGHIAILKPKSAQVFNLGSRFLVSNIILMINKLDLLWLPNFIALGMVYFIFGTKFSWNERIDACFNVECVLLGCNFDFLGGYLVVTARYLVVTAGYWSLLVVTATYWSLLLVHSVSMSDSCLLFLKKTYMSNDHETMQHIFLFFGCHFSDMERYKRRIYEVY